MVIGQQSPFSPLTSATRIGHGMLFYPISSSSFNVFVGCLGIRSRWIAVVARIAEPLDCDMISDSHDYVVLAECGHLGFTEAEESA